MHALNSFQVDAIATRSTIFPTANIDPRLALDVTRAVAADAFGPVVWALDSSERKQSTRVPQDFDCADVWYTLAPSRTPARSGRFSVLKS